MHSRQLDQVLESAVHHERIFKSSELKIEWSGMNFKCSEEKAELNLTIYDYIYCDATS
jgi:hypothetical protein